MFSILTYINNFLILGQAFYGFYGFAVASFFLFNYMLLKDPLYYYIVVKFSFFHVNKFTIC